MPSIVAVSGPSELQTPIVIKQETEPELQPIPSLTSNIPTMAPAPAPTPSRRAGRQGRMPAKERVVNRASPVEAINFPPCENLSQFHRDKLLEMKLYPSDGIGKYTRSIPFKGAKESFLKKTGRNRFDVFEYRFAAPNVKGEMKFWWVMWDYYNGLVRVHDFFDCCKPGKTEPGNAVKEKINPGLADICHNITGGNLHAQGYWIPFEAAKALAAKFCFKIRFALTIIFGEDFPQLCLPESHPEFGKYSIDPEIIERCRQRSVEQYLTEQKRLTQALREPQFSAPAHTSPSPFDGSPTPDFRSTHIETPEPEKRYFDPVRGGYTTGNSNRYRDQRSRSPDNSPVIATSSNSQRYRGEGGFQVDRSGSANPLRSPAVSRRANINIQKVVKHHHHHHHHHLPPVGHFIPPPPPPPPLIIQRHNINTALQPQPISCQESPRRVPVYQASDLPSLRQVLRIPELSQGSTSYHPSEPPKQSSPRKRQAPPHLSSPLPPLHPREPATSKAFNSPMHPLPKRRRIIAPYAFPQNVSSSPYNMNNTIKFNLETFTNTTSLARSGNVPAPLNPYTRQRLQRDRDLRAAAEEEEAFGNALEAAGNLLVLQMKDRAMAEGGGERRAEGGKERRKSL
ncbi:hypothetical protein RUND412_000472 [Rhizina undulata]